MTPTGKLLIVDDDRRNIFALKAVLKAKGYDCLTATSGAEGLEILGQEKDIRVVLLDMMMPDMDGYETIRAVRSGPLKDIGIISVTAQAMMGDMEKCLQAGADAYVSKPIDIDRLIAELRKFHL